MWLINVYIIYIIYNYIHIYIYTYIHIYICFIESTRNSQSWKKARGVLQVVSRGDQSISLLPVSPLWKSPMKWPQKTSMKSQEIHRELYVNHPFLCVDLMGFYVWIVHSMCESSIFHRGRWCVFSFNAAWGRRRSTCRHFSCWGSIRGRRAAGKIIY